MKKTDKMSPEKCIHCGDLCTDIDIEENGNHFCCNGCKMVYEILNTNDLCQYYDLDENAGVSLKGVRTDKFAYLDDPEIIDKLVDFKDDNGMRISFYIPSIHCTSCLWLLEKLYKLREGIINSRVNFPAKKVFVSIDPKVISLRELVELLTTIGYEPDITLNDLEEERKTDRKLMYQIGLAGFTFGNIMMLSFPEYIGLESIDDQWYGRIFAYTNVFLSIPVLFYSGMPYLKSAYLGIKERVINIDVPISIGMLTLFIRSLYDIISATGPGYLDSLSGLIFFLLIGKWFQQRTYYSLSFERDYKSYFPIAANLFVEGKEIPRQIHELIPGDIILIRNEELIPADGILTEGKAMIDYSYVNGEETPVSIELGKGIYAGGRQKGEAIKLTLTKAVAQSYLFELWNDEVFQVEGDLRASKIADTIGKYFTWIILSIAIAAFLFWWGVDKVAAINIFTAVLIIACPCAVSLSIPFTFGNAMRILSRKGLYLKNTMALEMLHEIDHVVFDKTGTITDTTNAKGVWLGKALSSKQKSIAKSLVHQSSHPVSRQIDSLLESTKASLEDFNEIIGKGIIAKINNQIVGLGSKKLLVEQLGNKYENFEEGTHFWIDEEYLGMFNTSVRPRENLKEVLRFFSTWAKVSMISGDNEKQRHEMKKYFPAGSELLFNQTPKEKLKYIKKLQRSGAKVMMVGDGLNDSGAIKQSDLGMVISENINNFTPASDAILEAKGFSDLPKMLIYGKKMMRLVFYAYGIASIYNIVGLTYAVTGNVSPIVAAILMPISSVSIVIFSIITSTLMAKKYKVI